MTDKRSGFEDKSETAPIPRSLGNLLSITAELKAATQRQHKDQIESLLEDAERVWLAAQHDNLNIFSRQGDQVNCQRYADALNSCNAAVFDARRVLMR